MSMNTSPDLNISDKELVIINQLLQALTRLAANVELRKLVRQEIINSTSRPPTLHTNGLVSRIFELLNTPVE